MRTVTKLLLMSNLLAEPRYWLGNPLFGRRRPRFLRPQLADADDAALLSLSLLCRVARRPLNGYKSGRRKQSALVAPEKPRAKDGLTDGRVGQSPSVSEERKGGHSCTRITAIR